MGERTHYEHGTFSWTDLATTDPDAAKSLYSDLFGWEMTDQPISGGGVYSMAARDGRAVAALSQVQRTGQPPAWNAYVTVDDVDAAAARAGELGGSVAAEPFDVMDAGRMTVLQDPTGAFFCAWQAGENIGAELVNGPGLFSLTQLNTPEPDRARDFYERLFGWRFDHVSAEPPYWGIYVGERLNAGMMRLPPEMGAPAHWLVYFGADDLDAAADTVRAAGGSLRVEKTDVPGGSIVVARDAQGAAFGLISGRFDD